MASIPPSAFSAGRIRESQHHLKVSNIKTGTDTPKYFNTKRKILIKIYTIPIIKTLKMLIKKYYRKLSTGDRRTERLLILTDGT